MTEKSKSVVEKIIRYIKIKFSVTVNFFSKISFMLKFDLILPRIFHVSRKAVVRDDSK